MKYITLLLLLPYLATFQGCAVKIGDGSVKKPLQVGVPEIKGQPAPPRPRVEVKFSYSSTNEVTDYRELQDRDELRTGDRYRVEFTTMDECFIYLYREFDGKQELLGSSNGTPNKLETLPKEDSGYRVEEHGTFGPETLLFIASYSEKKGKVEKDIRLPDTFVKSVMFKHIR